MSQKTINIILLFGLVATIIYSVWSSQNLKKVVVADAIELVNEFSLKKELESKVEGKLNEYNHLVDSLNGIVENSSNPNYKKKITLEMRNIQEEARQAYEISNRNINEQVWKRLNPWIEEFGKENDYKIIIGSNGMGTVLYNNNVTECTSDLIQFVNKKYETGS